MTFATVPVDAANVRAGHIIPVDGLIGRVTAVSDTGQGRLRISWEQADAGTPVYGVLPVRADATVLCVRYADWLASQPATPDADPWAEPGDLYLAWTAREGEAHHG